MTFFKGLSISMIRGPFLLSSSKGLVALPGPIGNIYEYRIKMKNIQTIMKREKRVSKEGGHLPFLASPTEP
jgi:hypothetical protein